MPTYTSTVATGSSSAGLDITSGQSLLVQSGGTVSSSTIETGGSATISGTASGDKIYGAENVSFGTAVAIGETVYAGGTLGLNLAGTVASNTMLSGGTLSINGRGETLGTTTISSGGSIILESAKATLSGSIVFAGPGSIEVTSLASVPTSSSYGDQAAISGFSSGDLIDLTVVSGATVTFATTGLVNGASLEAIVSGSSAGTAVTQSYFFAGVTSGNISSAVDGGGGFELTYVACYAEGTRILTESGEIAVEGLAVGDRVVTADGRLEPIRWIGRRFYSGRSLAGRRHLLPVRIKAGALAEATPKRDLLVSPMHAMLIDGVLVPAHYLLNGTTIVRQEDATEVRYVHVELDRHDAILAEGAASETFVDDDGRFIFQTCQGEPISQPGAAEYCAPRVDHGFKLEAIRRRIALRAELLTA